MKHDCVEIFCNINIGGNTLTNLTFFIGIIRQGHLFGGRWWSFCGWIAVAAMDLS